MLVRRYGRRAHIWLLIALIFATTITAYLMKDVQAATSLTIYVSSNADDGDHQTLPFGIFELWPQESYHIEMVSQYSTCYDWFRFQGVNVPQGAIIESAVLYVRAFADSGSTTINYRIQGFDEDNAAASTGKTDWLDRPKTSASVDVVLGAFVKDSLYSYYGLESIVQEIVDRAGWVSGNALVICASVVEYTFAKLCYSFEGANNIGDLTYAPRLYIRYSIPIHDVAVTEITPYKTQVTAGEALAISVVVQNEGQAQETFDVTLYHDGTAIDTQAATDLNPSATQRLDFEWDTTGVGAGAYTIKAVAATVSGETDTADNTRIDGTVTVNVLESPTAAFEWSPALPNVGETVSFDASASIDSDGSITKYEWDWTNDGTYDQTATTPPITHTYPAAGTYEVTLRVTDNDGLTATYTNAIQVSTPSTANEPPVAEAGGLYSGAVGEAIAFSATGSEDPDGTITAYRWDFGDETGYAYEQSPSHTYTAAGTYTVTLQVTDDEDATATDATQCTVVESGGAIIAGVVTDGETGTPITGATVTANGYTDTTGSDGTYSLSVNPGTYEVTVSVNDYEENTGSVTVAAGDSRTKNFGMTPASNGFPLIPIAAVAGAAAAIVAFFLLRRKPREEAPRPAALRITVDPTELLADGRSSSTITIELLDKDGKPMKAPQNTEVRLSASKGRVVSPVTIGEGQTSVAAKLVSSMEVGEVRVATAARGLEGTSTTLTFVEKKRYCMHCGTRMPVDVNRCPRCGREPPSGVDVKACPNCGEVIPKVAGFCSACGASQA
jgi:PKD repeat protein/RNA polymerase subunit RPABC4/transcription elongation factor Spt4